METWCKSARKASPKNWPLYPAANNGHLVYRDGYLYVLARKDGRVYRVAMDGKFTVFAGNGTRGKQNGKALESSFSLPNSLAFSPDGNWLYINETSPVSGDHRILGPTPNSKNRNHQIAFGLLDDVT